MTARLFAVGIAGPSLAPTEREVLERWPARAVILFRRNLQSPDQIRALTGEIHRLPQSPLICVDQEGGTVDRFRDALAPSISFAQAARIGAAGRAGELAGESCALLGFDVDLAPVVDRRIEGASSSVLRDRCAGTSTVEIAESAHAFLSGLHAWGVGGCVKHFPGLGRATLDTHKELPVLADDAKEEERDLAPFAATMGEAGAVMVSHAAGPEGTPASLSPAKARDLLRGRLGFAGAAFSDDLEMGALAAFGDLPRRSVLAAEAGCDLLLVCSRIDVYPDCLKAVEKDVPPERLQEASQRLDGYVERLERTRSAAPRPPRCVEELVAEIHRLQVDGEKA